MSVLDAIMKVEMEHEISFDEMIECYQVIHDAKIYRSIQGTHQRMLVALWRQGYLNTK